MKTIILAEPPKGISAYNASKPAPASAIQVRHDDAKPTITKPGEYIIQIKASTVIRDNLTWPELYARDPGPPAGLGNDFAGIISEVHPEEEIFKVGDEVYGMTSAHRGGAWAEFVLVHSDELSLKPASLSWEEAAAVPLSGMTAVQAFERAALQLKTGTAKKVLITGASGGVGLVLIQLAVGAGHHVIAASSSRLRDEALLQSLHVNDHVEYARMESLGEIDVVIDTVGGDVLKRCWKVIAQDGALVSIDSASFNFVEEHKDIARAHSKAQAHAEFFIVEPRRKDLEHLTSVVEAGGLKIWIAQTFPLEAARQAYELVQSGTAGRGKVVLKV